jgi:hypothetical protein
VEVEAGLGMLEVNSLEELFLEVLVVVSLTHQAQQLVVLVQTLKGLLEEMVPVTLETPAWVLEEEEVLRLLELVEMVMLMEAMEELA